MAEGREEIIVKYTQSPLPCSREKDFMRVQSQSLTPAGEGIPLRHSYLLLPDAPKVRWLGREEGSVFHGLREVD